MPIDKRPPLEDQPRARDFIFRFFRFTDARTTPRTRARFDRSRGGSAASTARLLGELAVGQPHCDSVAAESTRDSVAP